MAQQPARRQQQIFTDDLVQSMAFGAAVDVGIVERAPNSSDEDSGDEDDIADEEEEDRAGKLPPGAAKVRWSKREDVRTE